MSEKTAADLVREAIKILQRGLPPGDLDDRGVISELWGLLDNAETREILAAGVGDAVDRSSDST